MFKNYLKIALRNLKRYKSFSFINIIGLAAGITCFIALFLFVLDELNYDTFHENADQIYRVYVHSCINGQESCNSKTGAPLGATLQRDFPEVLTYTRVGYAGSHVLRYNDQVFREWRVYTADSTYFKVFKFKFVEGDPKTALVEPNSIVLTETAARKYFGDENPVGKTFIVNGNGTYLITGLIKDYPKDSHFFCDFLLSMSTYPITESQYWLDLWYTTYVVLKKGTNPTEFEKKLEKTVIDYVGPQAQAILGVPIQKILVNGNQYGFHLQPLTSIYLHSKRKYGIDPNTEWSQVRSSDIAYTYIFSAVAIFILLIAVINFMNLATARSERRSKEVGIRKTLGTSKYRLIWQFIIESVLMTALAVILALILLEFVLPGFNHLSGKELNLKFFNNPVTIPLLVLFTILVGTLAGSYPAFFLSSVQPRQILKASSGRGTKKSSLRSILVIIQFGISITLISGTIVIKNQLHYLQTKNLGFKKEHLFSINNAGVLGNKIEVFKQELLKNSNIISLSNSSRMFNSGIPGNGYLYNKKFGTDPSTCQFLDVDYDFLETFQIGLKQGRFFSREFSTDSSACLINEAAIKDFQAEDPVGKELTKIGMGKEAKTYIIIGIIKDFNYESLHQQVRPLILHLSPPRQPANILTVRVNSNDLQNTIGFIEKTWNMFIEGEKCYHTFVDQNLARLYESERKTSTIMTIFSLLAIFIACLGLFGLTAFVTEQRVKEIGIRKVLGASVVEIIMLLSKEFTKWVILANLIAWPIAYLLMKNWLQDFAYRIDITWTVFVLAGILALIIALATVSLQAIKAALANPVESLRYE